MTVEEFVAELRASAPKHISPDWLGEQQHRAARYGLDWQQVASLIAEQQAYAVKKAAETP